MMKCGGKMNKVSSLELLRNEYLQYVLVEQRLSINTKESYENDLRNYCSFLELKKIS